MPEPTEKMRQQMRVHLRYMREVQGWTPDQCRQLTQDYLQHMANDDGFAIIAAHLDLNAAREAEVLARLGVRV